MRSVIIVDKDKVHLKTQTTRGGGRNVFLKGNKEGERKKKKPAMAKKKREEQDSEKGRQCLKGGENKGLVKEGKSCREKKASARQGERGNKPPPLRKKNRWKKKKLEGGGGEKRPLAVSQGEAPREASGG